MGAFKLWDKPMPKGEKVPSVVARHLRRKATKSLGPVAKARRAKAAKDARHALKIRAQCVERDGYCKLARYADVIGPCGGKSEWAHFGTQKRFKTRGRPPEERHTVAGSFMACTTHHQGYDAGQFGLVALDGNGTNGDLAVVTGAGARHVIVRRTDRPGAPSV